MEAVTQSAENDIPPCPVCGGNIRFCECMDDPFAHVPESAEKHAIRPDDFDRWALALLLRQAAREHLRLSEGDYWPSDVAVAQARAVIAAGYVLPPGADQ